MISSLLRLPAPYVVARVACLSLLGVVGCDTRREGGIGEGEAPAGVSQTARDGPVTLTITATPGALPFNEHAEVVIEVLAETGVTVEVVDYERSLGDGQHQFEYRATCAERQAAAATDDDRLRWTYRYELEFFLPGEYELPRPVVTFVDERGREGKASDAGNLPIQAEVRELTTEPLTVLARETSDVHLTPEELKEIATLPPIELAESWSLWWIAPPVVAAAVVIAVLLVGRRRRRRVQQAIIIPAHEWARRRIAALIADKLVAKGLIQEFHYRVSGIVRGYIERRYRVLAMEMTTEEFLVAVAGDARFGERATAELNRFLGACDLVKYARHEPASSEADALLETAIEFVERTREVETRAHDERMQPVSAEDRAA